MKKTQVEKFLNKVVGMVRVDYGYYFSKVYYIHTMDNQLYLLTLAQVLLCTVMEWTTIYQMIGSGSFLSQQ